MIPAQSFQPPSYQNSIAPTKKPTNTRPNPYKSHLNPSFQFCPHMCVPFSQAFPMFFPPKEGVPGVPLAAVLPRCLSQNRWVPDLATALRPDCWGGSDRGDVLHLGGGLISYQSYYWNMCTFMIVYLFMYLLIHLFILGVLIVVYLFILLLLLSFNNV